MGDAEMETLTLTDSSCNEHSTSSVGPKKKRKLQCGLIVLDVPSPKQRPRIGAVIHEEPIVKQTQPVFEQQPEEKSENDSNSFSTRACDNSMASDVEVADENSLTLTIYEEQPSTSLNNYNNEVNVTSVYSFESRDVNRVSDATTSDMEEMYSGFGVDLAILELESQGDAKTESMILHSDDAELHSFFLSSGCWNLGQDAPLGKNKPTIDKEFEQYFSSLML